MIIQFLNRFRNAIKRKGIAVVIVQSSQFIFAIPIALVLILISPLVKIRFISLYASRIGEYAVNNYLMLCALESNDYPEEKNCKHFFYSYSDTPVCNQFFHKMWSRAIPILPCGALWSFVDRILIATLGEKYNTRFKDQYQRSGGGPDRQRYLFKDKKQFIWFTEKEKIMGETVKHQLGIPADKPFVCLLVRDSKYLQVHMSQTEDWKYHEYRDANIENYIPAIEFLIKKGFYVVRMGKHVDRALDINNPNCIDYANHSLRSDFMDVYLSAHCSFFISTNCGIDGVAQIFNRPLLTTNTALCDIQSFMHWILTIPRNVMCSKTDSLIPYNEIYRDYERFFLSGMYRPPQDPRRLMFAEWKNKGWTFVENTPDEILFVVKEMVDLLSQRYEEIEKSKAIQTLFWENFPPPFSFETVLNKNLGMYISPFFLKKYNDLLIKRDHYQDNLKQVCVS